MSSIFDNDQATEPMDPIKIPAKYRKKLIAQVLAGEIRPADFDDVFPMNHRIDVKIKWPPTVDYSKLSDGALQEIADQLPPDELNDNYFKQDPVTKIWSHEHNG